MKKKILLLILLSFQVIQSQVPTKERDALIAFYNSTDGVNWNPSSSTNWNTSLPVSDWAGVTVENITGQDHIVKIKLDNSYLNGTLPNEIGNLSELKDLEITFNESLTGNIPTTMGDLLKLESLVLWNNNLTGNIPSEIGNCTNLINLYLDNNQLTGNIPLSFEALKNIKLFFLDGNRFLGEIPNIFSDWSDLSYFVIGFEETLDFYNNFSGQIDLSNNTNLLVCSIYNNNISTLNVKNGNNSNITNGRFNTKSNPNLNCIVVDDITYSDKNWSNIDSTTQFRSTEQECNTLNVNEEIFENNIIVFPNPTSGIINILNSSEIEIKQIIVRNILGQSIIINEFKKTIDISKLPSGFYNIVFEREDGEIFNHKVIKE
ncbi:T9SS type A sorting domain-containing protein [Polaribacter sp. PL03]|uniref:T9SS type A sorting domain-containing protein n=1 Tax=Polaribacter sp. PL03 TaxID=3088353 RepID=UPI0029D19F6B|nr:T9SS type A sorting domain-containing protein [Polaribacter sp. PL03]MDX6747359.1 T9SS type A sorting domain-containing protein [Polaribacter sp. PL03]